MIDAGDVVGAVVEVVADVVVDLTTPEKKRRRGRSPRFWVLTVVALLLLLGVVMLAGSG